jgi:hypothetical protein
VADSEGRARGVLDSLPFAAPDLESPTLVLLGLVSPALAGPEPADPLSPEPEPDPDPLSPEPEPDPDPLSPEPDPDPDFDTPALDRLSLR